ncbi:hypothetical protein L5515_002092 [Caenorhabditis briggsae]|uniref:Non-structural maintenance of chromosomes element 1 homolog n=1 Tax=Caenorhabditis briggsae TaxID=6238 RepID=A0AAE9E4J9_CAEBR|nr:hypothetical protein L5515_002092 [Caenorhabditis briggsae]
MDLSDDEPGNLTDDPTPHDDFDLHSVLANLSTEAPSFEKFLKASTKFHDSHRYLINQFLLEPTMMRKKMNLLFAKHISTVAWGLHPEAFMRTQITPEQSGELSRSLVKTMNTTDGAVKKDFRPWRFVISTDEKSPTEYVTMTGCTRNSSIISEASSLTKSERALFLAILEEMMCEDGTCKMSWIHSIIQKEPHKITGPKCDEFMTRMARQKYITLFDSDIVEIAPRTIVELEPWLRATMPGSLKICEFCRRIISRPIYTAECGKCHSLSHFNCFKNATILSKQDRMECSKCNETLTLDEVNDQIVIKRTSGVARVPILNFRQSTSTRAASVDSPDDDDVVAKIEVDSDDEPGPSRKAPKAKKPQARPSKRAIISSDSDSN